MITIGESGPILKFAVRYGEKVVSVFLSSVYSMKISAASIKSFVSVDQTSIVGRLDGGT